MGSPHSRLVGGQYVTLIGDKMAKEQNTSKNIWSSKTKPPFKWIVHLKGLTPAEWSEPIHIAPALRQYFEHKNRRMGSKEGQWRNNGGNGGGGGNGNAWDIANGMDDGVNGGRKSQKKSQKKNRGGNKKRRRSQGGNSNQGGNSKGGNKSSRNNSNNSSVPNVNFG